MSIKQMNDANDYINFLVNSNTNGVRINGNAIWHSGNDGAGSSLDADLLDGLQGSLYAYADNTILNDDFNVNRRSGLYQSGDNVLNTPNSLAATKWPAS